MPKLIVTAVTLLAAMTVSGTPAAAAQDEPIPRPLTPDDYGQWERLGSGTLSPDGTWIAYQIRRVNEENELRIRLVNGDSVIAVPYGDRPAFSSDGAWLAYQIGMAEEERETLRKAKKPVRNDVGLLNLRTGEQSTVEAVRSFSFSDDGTHLAMHRYPPESKGDHTGVDLIVRTLATGTDLNFGNVAEYAWQDEGPLLAFVVDADGQVGNGVQVFDPTRGAVQVFDADQARYRGIAWREESADFAVLKVRADSLFEDSTHVVLAWTDAGTGPGTRHRLDPDHGIPAGMRVVEHRDLEWSEEGDAVFFGVQARIPKPENADSAIDKDDQPTVEVWHARDVQIIPEQKVRRQRLKEENYLAIWHLGDDRIVQLGDEVTETVSRIKGDRVALGMDRTPYDDDRMFGPAYRDAYLIDTQTGERTPIHSRIEFDFGISPAGKYYLFFQDDHYWTYDVERARLINATEPISTSFVNVDDNHTVIQKPPYRIAGWTEDDAQVLIYDKYDVWAVRPDGSGGTRITRGAEDGIRYRYARLDREEEFVDLQSAYFSTYNEWTEEWGFARMNGPGRPETLVWGEARVSGLIKADEADVYAYIRQSVADSPDYLVGGPALTNARTVTKTNPFHGEFALSERVELLDYHNTWGAPLQGALTYPANYDSTRTYPMIVYIYEIVSTAARSYSAPSERSAYNTAVWTANGYFVYRPDITYRDRNPGLSAVEALEPAVARAIETGMIDPDRIGLVGHSWGGYQTAFTVTQTDIFAAAVAGAPLTNLTSMYLSVYWNSGGTDARIFEISQGRMEVPFWEDVDSYIANSPVFHVDKLNTPLLVAHGTEDGAVDYNQGVEYYNAARRAGKDFVLLVYNGENHGNRKKPNQIDYHNRIMQWFGHYLKGEPAPEWIVEGLPYETQQRILKYGPKVHKALIP